MDATKAIGKNIKRIKLDNYDWNTRWPVVDETGKILSIIDGDTIPEDAVLVWQDMTETDGSNGFDAVIL